MTDTRITAARAQIERLKGQRDRNLEDLKHTKRKQRKQERRLENQKKALEVIQSVARQTQKQLEYRVSELATLALAGVLQEPYTLSLDFETKGTATQAHIYFERDRLKIAPMDAAGGGAVDIAALALQMTMWSIRQPRTRNLLILDEPLKYLKGKEMPIKGALMLRELSHRLGVQILMVSHSPELIQGADKIVEVGL